MSSMFDFDDSRQLAFQAKTAGKALIAAKYNVLQQTGDFLFNAHTDGEFAQRCAMIDDELSNIAYNKLASISDSKTKLVKALHTEWSLRHAKCQDCNCGNNRKFAKSTCEKCADGELDSDSPLCKACRGKEASRIIAKSICEMCGDGELDPNSEACKACGAKTASRHEAIDFSTIPHALEHGWNAIQSLGDQETRKNYNDQTLGMGELMGAGLLGYGLNKLRKNKNELAENSENEEKNKFPNYNIKNIRPDDRPFDWERDASAHTANKYIEKRGDSWVILQKGTDKVLSHHDSKEKAEASFRAMMQSKHGGIVTADDDNDNDDNNGGGGAGAGLLGGLARGIGGLVEDVAPLAALANRSSWVTAHMADGDYCPNCDGAGCTQCGQCPNCGNETDAYGDHYGMIGCPSNNSFNPMGIDDHNMSDMVRHDQGHDDWHAMYGDAPCTSEEDCAAKSSRYDDIDNMRDNGEPVKETDLHDALHEEWHRDHGDEPCTSMQDCARKSARYND